MQRERTTSKWFARILVGLSLVFAVAIAPSSPAQAGDGFWSQSSCRPDVWWYGFPGEGAVYWHQSTAEIWVGYGVHATYAANGYECGWLGAVRSSYLQGDRQYFECGYIYWTGWTYVAVPYEWGGCLWL